MKPFIFTLALLVFGTGMAHAGNGDIGSVAISRIDAQFRCEQAGGGFAFALPKNSEPARVWLLDKAGDQEGLELEVVDTKPYRCPNCFDIAAKTEMFGSKVEYVFQLRSSGGNFVPRLNVSLNGKALKFTDGCKAQH